MSSCANLSRFQRNRRPSETRKASTMRRPLPKMSQDYWFRSALLVVLLFVPMIGAAPMMAATGDTPPEIVNQSLAAPEGPALSSVGGGLTSYRARGGNRAAGQSPLASSSADTVLSDVGACPAVASSDKSASSSGACSTPYPLCDGPGPYGGETCCLIVPALPPYSGHVWFCLRKVCEVGRGFGTCAQPFETVASGLCD